MNGFRSLRASAVLFLSVILVGSLLSVSTATSAEDSGFQFRKVSELQSIQAKKPVRIKLKRTVKGQYSWELSGDDANEILRVDKQLRQVLKPQEKQKDRRNAHR